jgi:hypothetical protein
MPFKPPVVAKSDLVRARQIVRSLAPLKGLGCEDADTVARVIAQSFAEGRQRGMEIAMHWTDHELQEVRARSCAKNTARVSGN